jgi:hypothetical protein
MKRPINVNFNVLFAGGILPRETQLGRRDGDTASRSQRACPKNEAKIIAQSVFPVAKDGQP